MQLSEWEPKGVRADPPGPEYPACPSCLVRAGAGVAAGTVCRVVAVIVDIYPGILQVTVHDDPDACTGVRIITCVRAAVLRSATPASGIARTWLSPRQKVLDPGFILSRVSFPASPARVSRPRLPSRVSPPASPFPRLPSRVSFPASPFPRLPSRDLRGCELSPRVRILVNEYLKTSPRER
jgi:hypothetical protein